MEYTSQNINIYTKANAGNGGTGFNSSYGDRKINYGQASTISPYPASDSQTTNQSAGGNTNPNFYPVTNNNGIKNHGSGTSNTSTKCGDVATRHKLMIRQTIGTGKSSSNWFFRGSELLSQQREARATTFSPAARQGADDLSPFILYPDVRNGPGAGCIIPSPLSSFDHSSNSGCNGGSGGGIHSSTSGETEDDKKLLHLSLYMRPPTSLSHTLAADHSSTTAIQTWKGMRGMDEGTTIVREYRLPRIYLGNMRNANSTSVVPKCTTMASSYDEDIFDSLSLFKDRHSSLDPNVYINKYLRRERNQRSPRVSPFPPKHNYDDAIDDAFSVGSGKIRRQASVLSDNGSWLLNSPSPRVPLYYNSDQYGEGQRKPNGARPPAVLGDANIQESGCDISYYLTSGRKNILSPVQKYGQDLLRNAAWSARYSSPTSGGTRLKTMDILRGRESDRNIQKGNKQQLDIYKRKYGGTDGIGVGERKSAAANIYVNQGTKSQVEKRGPGSFEQNDINTGIGQTTTIITEETVTTEYLRQTKKGRKKDSVDSKKKMADIGNNGGAGGGGDAKSSPIYSFSNGRSKPKGKESVIRKWPHSGPTTKRRDSVLNKLNIRHLVDRIALADIYGRARSQLTGKSEHGTEVVCKKIKGGGKMAEHDSDTGPPPLVSCALCNHDSPESSYPTTTKMSPCPDDVGHKSDEFGKLPPTPVPSVSDASKMYQNEGYDHTEDVSCRSNGRAPKTEDFYDECDKGDEYYVKNNEKAATGTERLKKRKVDILTGSDIERAPGESGAIGDSNGIIESRGLSTMITDLDVQEEEGAATAKDGLDREHGSGGSQLTYKDRSKIFSPKLSHLAGRRRPISTSPTSSKFLERVRKFDTPDERTLRNFRAVVGGNERYEEKEAYINIEI